MYRNNCQRSVGPYLAGTVTVAGAGTDTVTVAGADADADTGECATELTWPMRSFSRTSTMTGFSPSR